MLTHFLLLMAQKEKSPFLKIFLLSGQKLVSVIDMQDGVKSKWIFQISILGQIAFHIALP